MLFDFLVLLVSFFLVSRSMFIINYGYSSDLFCLFKSIFRMLLKLLSVVLLVAPLCSGAPDPKIYLIETKNGGGDYSLGDTYIGGKDYADEGRISCQNFVYPELNHVFVTAKIP